MTPLDSGPSLVVISGGGPAQQISVPVNGLVLGRDSRLGPPFSTDQFVSRKHVSVRRLGDRVEVADLRSANGTYVNGRRVRAWVRMRDNDVLRIGQIDLKLAVPGGADQTMAGAGGVPYLTFAAPHALSGRRFPLPGYHLVVGRDPASGICLDDPYVSWTHAVLRRHADTVFVQDLGSRSGTFVNGKAVTGVRELRPGDIVAFASINARFDRGG